MGGVAWASASAAAATDQGSEGLALYLLRGAPLMGKPGRGDGRGAVAAARGICFKRTFTGSSVGARAHANARYVGPGRKTWGVIACAFLRRSQAGGWGLQAAIAALLVLLRGGRTMLPAPLELESECEARVLSPSYLLVAPSSMQWKTGFGTQTVSLPGL